jgi:hypothetical protein
MNKQTILDISNAYYVTIKKTIFKESVKICMLHGKKGIQSNTSNSVTFFKYACTGKRLKVVILLVNASWVISFLLIFFLYFQIASN